MRKRGGLLGPSAHWCATPLVLAHDRSRCRLLYILRTLSVDRYILLGELFTGRRLLWLRLRLDAEVEVADRRQSTRQRTV